MECCSTLLGEASPFCVCRQGVPGTRGRRISSVLGEETRTEVRQREESNQGFQGARARVSKGLRPPHLNNNQDKTKNGFRCLPFHVVTTSETDLS